MKISKRIIVAVLIAVAAGLSTAAIAQLSAKSQSLGKLMDGEVMRVNPATGTIQKSNIKVSEAQHQAALANDATEITPNTAIYKYAGKEYMFHPRAAANEQAAINFESQFDNE
jgi:hypothetical protein